ncbi:hypothetical protein KCP69_18390 [Salmonella enterica subsp. enterica]|nr:hypothetical protein KCP69_18390 [Salmonella enterica subsp. enterica]
MVSSDLRQRPQATAETLREIGTTLDNHFTVSRQTEHGGHAAAKAVSGRPAVGSGHRRKGRNLLCDEHGRVRVKFNWDRYNPANGDGSCWMRVVRA